MMRYFQKAMLRAEIDIRYSEGFNPHQIMSFAYPLGVSMETEGDYLDIDINHFESCQEITDRLNHVMKEGITILETSVVPEGEKTAMASVKAADYRVILCRTLAEKEIKQFMSKSEIKVIKEGKKENKEVNIKEGILGLSVGDNDSLLMRLCSGSSMNIKPSQVVEALNDFLNEDYSIVSLTRVEIYKEDAEGKLSGLGVFSYD
jgi:radical SAM-linked protein